MAPRRARAGSGSGGPGGDEKKEAAADGAGKASDVAGGEKVAAEGEKGKKGKYRRDKPWDNESIDHWKPVAIAKEDIGGGRLLLEESSFATLFPSYREQYLKQVWPDVKKILADLDLQAELNLIEGSMSVKTTEKTWDPYIIIKARDMLKLLARSVPFPQAQKILEDTTNCDIIKISGFVHSKERFVKRRQRLVGPNGSTLKAIELLTDCYVHVQGQTVCLMGSIKGIKQVRRIIEDCFKNIHPIYHIKELMIRRELEKDPELKGENWDRFLPHFKKQNVQRQKKKIKKKKSRDVFPPQQMPRKEDLMMETGEYFLNEQEREQKKRVERQEKQKVKTIERKKERAKVFEPPAATAAGPPSKKRKRAAENDGETPKAMAERLKERAAKTKAKTRTDASSLLL
eukprot:TRINITY_DN70281_c0_g1_i1.p1 TRINITY_DN70281_c0_g1~~TRINITY_DN70281_c0_g1_i1.p1  ORF type:complete len:401 (-),score=94.91 TRINITY_DN70281_c0_g1_i1:62-1264(-)